MLINIELSFLQLTEEQSASLTLGSRAIQERRAQSWAQMSNNARSHAMQRLIFTV